MELLKNKIFDVLDGACGEIRLCSAGDGKVRVTSDCNHILLRLDYDPNLNTTGWHNAAEEAVKSCQSLLVKHRVTGVEIIYHEPLSGARRGSSLETYRLIYTNETGAIPEFCVYKVIEVKNYLIINNFFKGKLKPIGPRHARLNGESCYATHKPISHVHLQKKRLQANKINTTYVYDYPLMFGQACLNTWLKFKESNPNSYNK